MEDKFVISTSTLNEERTRETITIRDQFCITKSFHDYTALLMAVKEGNDAARIFRSNAGNFKTMAWLKALLLTAPMRENYDPKFYFLVNNSFSNIYLKGSNYYLFKDWFKETYSPEDLALFGIERGIPTRLRDVLRVAMVIWRSVSLILNAT
jgi:hypothetical protein